MSTLFQINVVANSGSTGRIAEGIAEAVIMINGLAIQHMDVGEIQVKHTCIRLEIGVQFILII